jgi:alcohol dehydrogenase class IV
MGFPVEGMRRVTWSLRRAVEHGADLDAREDMSLASLFGGLALANAGLGAVHGFAAPIGGMFPAPHGAVCAALLPATMAVNVRALHSRQAGSPALRRYAKIARILTRQPSATPEQGVEWVRGLCRELKVPGLREYGIASSHFPQLVEKAEQASSMKANPVVLTKEELEEILRGSWE